MKKILLFSLVGILIASFLSGVIFFALLKEENAIDTVAAEGDGKNYILAGLDEAGNNTDMLLLVSVKEKGNALSFLQIPRDTYLSIDGFEGKINQIYSRKTTKKDQKRAAESFLTTISTAFDLPLHGYVIFRQESLKDAVDALGGIPLLLDEDLVCADEAGREYRIPKGERLLNGEEACYYVRHRATYAEGDLGRLDAQLRFLSAAFTELTKGKDLVRYLRLYKKVSPSLLTNLEERDIISLAGAFVKNRDGKNVRLMRLPGEATKGKSGSWYYIANQKESERLLGLFFACQNDYRFDESHRFVRFDRENFKNIYADPLCRARVYTLTEASRLKVIKKQ